MIFFQKSTDGGIQILNTQVDNCWINLVDPTREEIDRISQLGIPQDFITYALDLDERARSEREDNGQLLVVVRIPCFQGEAFDVPYITIPMAIILTEKYIVTVCKRETDIINQFTNGKVRGFSTGKRNRFLLQLLHNTADRYISHLREINKITESLEDKLQLALRNREIIELLKYQKSLVYFATAVKTNELVLERLQRSQLFRMYPEDEDLLEDAITENQQALEVVNISSSILSSMMDAFASIISNNQNQVLKFLASVTVVMGIPTIVTSFFGMNVGLPFAQHSLAALIVFGIVFLVAGLVVVIFVKRDWF